MISTGQLLDELVDRWTRGEPLEVDELLRRAGPHADELARLIDTFLERAPRREPTAESIAFVRSLDEPSLLRARQEQRLKLDDLTEALVERLGLKESARTKVRRYYQDLELGRLEPKRVAQRVWDALGDVLGRDARELVMVRAPAPAAPAMYRASNHLLSMTATGLPDADLADRGEPDEVDRLFGVGGVG